MAPRTVKLYVAADYARMGEAKDLLSEAMILGVEPICRWAMDGTAGDGLGGELGVEEAHFAETAAMMDFDDIDASNVFIQLTTGIKVRGGRHVELGYAIAKEMPVLVVGPREHVFHYHRNISHVQTFGEALAWLDGYMQP